MDDSWSCESEQDQEDPLPWGIESSETYPLGTVRKNEDCFWGISKVIQNK